MISSILTFRDISLTYCSCDNVMEFCIKNEELCIQNDEFCIKNEELCI